MLPYYKRVTAFLKAHGVKIIFVDTDGDCTDSCPCSSRAVVTGMYPIEANCGMDIVKVRKHYPRLQLMGGIPKSEISTTGDRLEGAPGSREVHAGTGGFIPHADHLIPPGGRLRELLALPPAAVTSWSRIRVQVTADAPR